MEESKDKEITYSNKSNTMKVSIDIPDMDNIHKQNQENFRKEKWYNMNIFPIIPLIEIRESNEHNTYSISFSWLIFRFWTLDSFQFEFSIVASEHWGFGFVGLIPYLRWVVAIPCPEWLGIRISKALGRRPSCA